MVQIGIVGSGGMAGERVRAFGGQEGACVAAVYARSLAKAQLLAGPAGAAAFDHLERMLPEVDALVVCVPNAAHADLARRALAAGKHVLVEYPLCTSLEDARALCDLALDAGRVLMVGNTIVHEAMFRYLREHRGRLGRILSAASRVAFYDGSIAGHWYLREESTGPVFAAFHYHHIEYYRHFLGDVEWVLARDEGLPDAARPGCASTAGGTLVMAHAGGATSCVQWYLSAEGSGMPRGLWINGSRSSVTILSREAERSLVVWDGGGEGNEETYEDDWGVAGSCRDFLDAIAGRLDRRARLDWDIETMRTGLLAAESAARGEQAVIHREP